MTTSTLGIRPFDVAIAWVAYADHPGVGKPRPVVVLSFDSQVALVVVAKVTSHEPRPDVPGEVLLADWAEEGLAKPSTVRCSQVVELRCDDIGQVIGSLSNRDRENVLAGLDEAMGSL